MSIVTNRAQRDDWIRRVSRIQLELHDLELLLDVAMRQPPAPHIQRLLAEADAHVARASAELIQAVNRIGRL